jgi:hypothetical protein
MKEWFEGKTVSIVGNAESLMRQSYGTEIDQADVVVRINRGGYRYPEFTKQMGTKLTVWCMQNAKQNKMFFHKSYTQNVLKMQMDTIDVSPNFIELVNCVFSNDDKMNLDGNLPKKSSTGLRVLYYVRKQNPLKVSVYGFDWKQTYSWHEKRKCIAHDFTAEKDYCFKHIFNDDIFTLKGYS